MCPKLIKQTLEMFRLFPLYCIVLMKKSGFYKGSIKCPQSKLKALLIRIIPI